MVRRIGAGGLRRRDVVAPRATGGTVAPAGRPKLQSSRKIDLQQQVLESRAKRLAQKPAVAGAPKVFASARSKEDLRDADEHELVRMVNALLWAQLPRSKPKLPDQAVGTQEAYARAAGRYLLPSVEHYLYGCWVLDLEGSRCKVSGQLSTRRRTIMTMAANSAVIRDELDQDGKSRLGRGETLDPGQLPKVTRTRLANRWQIMFGETVKPETVVSHARSARRWGRKYLDAIEAGDAFSWQSAGLKSPILQQSWSALPR